MSVVLLTTCVQWARCCVWEQRWSEKRGKGCWIPPGEAERIRWWTAAGGPTPPEWSWTPRPRTTSSPVQNIKPTFSIAGLLLDENTDGEFPWHTFSLKCHDPPTITAWALKSCTFISPVPHINSWRDLKRKKSVLPSGVFKDQQDFYYKHHTYLQLILIKYG